MPIHRTLNQNFFKTWSSEMAYVLGFFAADGNMIRNNRGGHFIAFYSNDKELLEKIRNLLGSNHKLAPKKRNNFYKNRKQSYQLQIGSKEIFKDLINLGMVPNKSLILKMPNVPEELLGHFLRGYFDGDGHVSVCEYQRKDRKSKSKIIQSGFTSGSKKFLEGLRIVLKKHTNIQGGTLHRGSKKSNYYRFCVSINDSLRLYDFMYKNDNLLSLSRKKSIFEDYFKLGT
ncbi:MAG: LAGLIDADG family homing endonuclease [Patescibacteria group bacterium]